MFSLQRLSDGSLGSATYRHCITLVLPLALLCPLTPWAIRHDESEETGANLLVAQDANWPCTRDNFTEIHRRIGNYSNEQLVRLRCHEPLLLLVQRDLLMIRRLKELMKPDKFADKFPPNFIKDDKAKKVIWSTIEAAANAVGFGLHGAPALVDDIVFNGVSPVYDYAEYAKGLKHEKKAKALREQAKSLFDSGAKKVSFYFSDMVLGMLYELYSKLFFAFGVVQEGAPMIIKSTVLQDRDGNPVTSEFSHLAVGTAIQLNPTAVQDGKVSVTVSGHAVVSGIDKGWIRVEGWVDSTSVSLNGGFLRWKGSNALQACIDHTVGPCKDQEHQTIRIEKGQVFKVVRIQTAPDGKLFWQLAGGIGYVPWFEPYKSKMEGPLPQDEAMQVQRELEDAVTLPEGSDIVTFKGLSAFNDMWGSRPAQTSKVTLGVGLFIGGIFTHGLLWIVASAYGVANAVTDAGLAIALSELLSSHVGYVLMALANFERELFAGRTDHQACRLGNNTGCARGFACVHHGVFYKTLIARPTQKMTLPLLPPGKCVKSPQQELMPLNGVCSVDLDCASGICNPEKSGDEVARLLGKCGSQFE